jgi:hypothetical protein
MAARIDAHSWVLFVFIRVYSRTKKRICSCGSCGMGLDEVSERKKAAAKKGTVEEN